MDRLLNFKWKDFFWRLYERTEDAEIFGRAAQTAFYFTFAIFPLLYFLISVFGLVMGSDDGLRGELFIYLRRLMPIAAFTLVQNTLLEIVENSSSSKLTIGLIITLWSASAGLDAVRITLNAVSRLRERRSWWNTKLRSILLTLILAVLAMLTLTIVFYGWQLVQMFGAWAGFPALSPIILVAVQWISIVTVMLVICEIIFNLLPDHRVQKWIWITPGSIVAIVLWLVLTSIFRFYLVYLSNYNKAYGSLGAVIILLLWLFLTAMVLLIGGAINSVLADMRHDRAENE